MTEVFAIVYQRPYQKYAIRAKAELVYSRSATEDIKWRYTNAKPYIHIQTVGYKLASCFNRLKVQVPARERR